MSGRPQLEVASSIISAIASNNMLLTLLGQVEMT